MGIRFDGQACADFLYLNLVGAMKQLQQELLNEAKQGMLTREGAESLHEDEIKDIAGVIVAGIVGGAWAAMDEWGTGHMLDTSNPALQDYKNSPLWNPLRQDDNYVRGRPAGTYTDIFGEQRTSTGKMAGRIIEYPYGKFVPNPPSHAIQTAMRWMQNRRFKKKIQETVQNFPFGKFLICDTK